MTDIIERAARAVRNEIAVYSKSKGAFVVEGKVVRDELFQTVARAVLRAIREPSDGLCEAGGAAIEAMPSDDVSDGYSQSATAWQAMIDKALGEE